MDLHCIFSNFGWIYTVFLAILDGFTLGVLVLLNVFTLGVLVLLDGFTLCFK